MTGTGQLCPNGHPAVLPGQRFCETCGATLTMAAGQPPAPPAAPLPPPPAPPPPAGPPGVPSPGTLPPARRGPSPAIVLGLILLIAVAGGTAAFVLIAKPFSGGAAGPVSSVADATPAASHTALATLPPATAIPGQTLESSPRPTPEPSSAPTGAPATPTPTPPGPSALPTDVPTAACRSETVGITVTYPLGWHAYTGDAQWTCLLFDPQPIDIQVDSEVPSVAVAIFDDTRPASTVAADFETATVYTILSTDSGTVDGRPAVAYEVENTGQGFYEKGVRQTVVIVDRGTRGSLVLETTGTAGERYDGNVEELARMVEALKID